LNWKRFRTATRVEPTMMDAVFRQSKQLVSDLAAGAKK
jgi:hypothetical protein